MFQTILIGTFLLCWGLVSLISLNHLYPVCHLFSNLPTEFLGWLGWVTGTLALAYYGRKHFYQLLTVTILFFLLGYELGPFLDPPADPLEHLRRVYEVNCQSVSSQVPRENYGLWQYSMVGVIICSDSIQIKPATMLTKIDIANGLFWALMAGTLYVLGLRSGLDGRWSFVSILICFLFFGTNKVSYFKYYSFSPSCSSMVIFWLWTAAFFFKKQWSDFLAGIGIALLALPIIWVNHRQEAVFLGFVVIVWCILNAIFTLDKAHVFLSVDKKKKIRGVARFFTVNGLFLFLMFVLFCVLPQFEFFRQWLNIFFVNNYSKSGQLFSLSWLDLFTGKYAQALRIKDTLGLISVPMYFLVLPYFWLGLKAASCEQKVRIYTLAILPFIGYLIPFFHFAWAFNVKFSTYYRLCYASMFWILFADFLFSIEKQRADPHSKFYRAR